MSNNCRYGFYTCQFVGKLAFCNNCDEGQNYQMKQPTQGGSRPGSGRKPKEPTVTIAFRVKASHSEEIKEKIKVLIKQIQA